MNLLTSLLTSGPVAPPKKVRAVVAPEMQTNRWVPHRGKAYGTVQPRIEEFLKTVRHASPYEIAKALNLNGDSTRRGIRALVKKELIVCIRESNKGHHLPGLFRIADEEDV